MNVCWLQHWIYFLCFIYISIRRFDAAFCGCMKHCTVYIQREIENSTRNIKEWVWAQMLFFFFFIIIPFLYLIWTCYAVVVFVAVLPWIGLLWNVCHIVNGARMWQGGFNIAKPMCTTFFNLLLVFSWCFLFFSMLFCVVCFGSCFFFNFSLRFVLSIANDKWSME